MYPKRVKAIHPVPRFAARVMEPQKSTDGTYVITVRGVAGPWVRAAFDEAQVSVVGDTTELRSAGADQAALYGFLHRIEDLALEVIDVHLESAEPT